MTIAVLVHLPAPSAQTVCHDYLIEYYNYLNTCLRAYFSLDMYSSALASREPAQILEKEKNLKFYVKTMTFCVLYM